MMASTWRTGNVGEHAAHQAARIVVVVDDVVLANADGLAELAQEARGDAVEGAEPHAVRALAGAAEETLDALLQLAGGLVGERHGQDAPRIRALRKQVRQTVGNHARFARACARDDQERLRRIENGIDLRWVQLAAEGLRRKASGRARRRRREEIRRFHALVIQIAGVAVDSRKQVEAQCGSLRGKTGGPERQRSRKVAEGHRFSALILRVSLWMLLGRPALGRSHLCVERAWPQAIEDEAEKNGAVGLAKMPAEVTAARAAHGVAPRKSWEPRVFETVRPDDRATDGRGKAAEVKGEAGGIEESVVVRTAHGDAVLGAGDRGATRSTQNRLLSAQLIVDVGRRHRVRRTCLCELRVARKNGGVHGSHSRRDSFAHNQRLRG
jgi:hypothetical protein